MPKITTEKANFTAGELSPRLYGRTDLGRYDNGAQIIENFFVQPHGGVTRRPGTRFVREVKASANEARLIPFQFNVEQAYVLEFGNNYFRIYKDGGVVISGGNPVEVTTTYTSAQLSQLKFAQTADLMYLVHPDHVPRKITRTSHTAWTISDVDLVRGAMGDTNRTTTTLTANGRSGSVTVTASANLFVSTDVGRLIKLHKGFAKITAFSSATSVTAAVQELADGRSELMPSYSASTISFHEGDPDSTGLEHNDRIEDSAGNFIVQGFERGMRITTSSTSSNNKSAMLIVDVTDTVITLAPGVDLAAESAGSSKTINGDLIADNDFQLGAFSTTTGFPTAIAFYEQRLVFAGTATQPQTIFFSQGGDFENFERGVDGDDGLVYTIGSNEVNVIRYLASGRQLIVGTSGGEFAVRASGFDEPINPTNTQIKQQTTYGSANIQPLQVGNATLFLQRAKRKMREFVFSNESDSYVAPDMTILAEHVTEGGIKEFAYQQEPDSIAWCVREDGILACMTYRREEQVVAWHRHIIGGRFGECTVTVSDYANIAVGSTITLTKSDGTTVTFTSEAAGGSDPASSLGFRPNTNNNTTADNIFTAINAHSDFTVANPSAAVVTITETNHLSSGFLTCVTSDPTRLASTNEAEAVVESVAIIPGDLDEDQVWFIVKRTVDGSTKRYVEYISGFDFGTDIEDAFFVDSGLTYSGSAATSISGLTHLEGQTVSILANGSTHPDKTVASGAITLDRSVTKAHIGLPFTSKVETLRVDQGSASGSSQGKTKRISEVTVRLYRSVGLEVGTSSSELDRIPFRSSAAAMDAAVPLFSGDKTIEFRGGFDDDATIVAQQSQPLPTTLLAIYPTVSVFDK